MKNLLTPDSIANAVRLSRVRAPKKTALLLEGGTDLKLYRNLIDTGRCEPYVGDDRKRVLQTLAILERSKVPGVLAIVDADTDHLDNRVSTNPNVVTTETRDIEGILLRSPALEKVLNEHSANSASVPDPAGLIVSAARSLGYLRWISKTNNWSMDFKELDFAAFIKRGPVQCDVLGLCREVLKRNAGFARTETELAAEIARAYDASHDAWHVAQGHDMVKILGIIISSQTGRSLPPAAIASDLRLAFETAFFTRTQLYVAICAWQNRNQPFIVLRISCTHA